MLVCIGMSVTLDAENGGGGTALLGMKLDGLKKSVQTMRQKLKQSGAERLYLKQEYEVLCLHSYHFHTSHQLCTIHQPLHTSIVYMYCGYE